MRRPLTLWWSASSAQGCEAQGLLGLLLAAREVPPRVAHLLHHHHLSTRKEKKAEGISRDGQRLPLTHMQKERSTIIAREQEGDSAFNRIPPLSIDRPFTKELQSEHLVVSGHAGDTMGFLRDVSKNYGPTT